MPIPRSSHFLVRVFDAKQHFSRSSSSRSHESAHHFIFRPKWNGRSASRAHLTHSARVATLGLLQVIIIQIVVASPLHIDMRLVGNLMPQVASSWDARGLRASFKNFSRAKETNYLNFDSFLGRLSTDYVFDMTLTRLINKVKGVFKNSSTWKRD